MDGLFFEILLLGRIDGAETSTVATDFLGDADPFGTVTFAESGYCMRDLVKDRVFELVDRREFDVVFRYVNDLVEVGALPVASQGSIPPQRPTAEMFIHQLRTELHPLLVLFLPK